MKRFLKNYQTNLQIALNSLDDAILKEICEKIIELKNNNKTIYLFGNGGSSATPSHSAGDWRKELNIKTICLSDNTPALTAYANDTDYNNIFLGQLQTFLTDGDIVIGYSGSGNSKNVINAIEYAKSKSNYTIGITGNYNNMNGGLLSSISDLSIIVNSTSMEIIEDMHLIINHIIKEYIKSLNE